MRHVSGNELKVGDTIEVWWTPKRDTITSLQPYDGPLSSLWPKGAQIAQFAQLKSGMTIDNADIYLLING